MEYLIVFLPLIGAIISVFFGNKFGSKYSELLTSILVGISAILSLIVFFNVIYHNYESNIIVAKWIYSGNLQVNWSIKIDALSSVMLVVVTLVSSLVHIY